MSQDESKPTDRRAELEYAISWWLDRSRVVENAMDYVEALRSELRGLMEIADAE